MRKQQDNNIQLQRSRRKCNISLFNYKMRGFLSDIVSVVHSRHFAVGYDIVPMWLLQVAKTQRDTDNDVFLEEVTQAYSE